MLCPAHRSAPRAHRLRRPTAPHGSPSEPPLRSPASTAVPAGCRSDLRTASKPQFSQLPTPARICRVDLIKTEFRGTSAEADLNRILEDSPTNQYQRAFEFLNGRRGQDAANRIVRTAVLQAINLVNCPKPLPTTRPESVTPDDCNGLEAQVDAWALPTAVDHLGKLLVDYPNEFGKALLTTNFDPLIEISVSKHKGSFYRTVLHDDGKLGQTVAAGTHIVHLHGYWQGYDTLHTPQQLTQPRPHLRRSLERVLDESSLAVVGYSGWDDVITRTLIDLMSDSASNPEVMWAFYEEDPILIEAQNQGLLDALDPGIGRGRVSLYRGIDCRRLFHDLYQQLNPEQATIDNAASTRRDPVILTPSAKRISSQQVPLTRSTTAAHYEVDTDRPLIVTPWIGRQQELDILASSTATTPIVFITGLGGQGKSALAGRFLQQQAIAPAATFEFWDWRDCKEESDRLNTQVLRLVQRLSNGAIDPSQVEVNDISAVIGVLFHALSDRRAFLVFDNVDQYVDLETLRPAKGLDVLVSEVQARSHQSLFVFTCRPDIRVDESRALRIPLSGLSEAETTALIEARNIPRRDHQLARELHRTTNGHPLWVSLIVMQAVRHRSGLRGALEQIVQGGATLPDTLRTIWGSLNDQQRNVLRTMAELDRPESMNHLLELIPGINANRVNRALRALRSLHMVEARTESGGEPLLGLHPIIRESIRTTFPKGDREQYAGMIVAYLDRMIDRYKNLLPQDPAYEILENWIRRAEFDITFGHFERATSTIAEIAWPLVDRGYSEELIRLSLRLFREIDWAESSSTFRAFDAVFAVCLKQMIEVGHDATGELLSQYEAAIPGKSSQYILLCDLRCYMDWFLGKYESAIRWGEEGERLQSSTAVDTRFSTRHHLALSRRDSGRVSEAIETFLRGESLESVVAPGVVSHNSDAPFYGNIGRCLFLSDRLEEALSCYVKSATILEESRAHSARLNKGYIRYWIGEILERQREFEQAAASYRAAVCMWHDSSPRRAGQASGQIQNLVKEHPQLGTYLDLAGWKAERAFHIWLDKR